MWHCLHFKEKKDHEVKTANPANQIKGENDDLIKLSHESADGTIHQLNMTLCAVTTRLSPRLSWRFTALFATNSTMVIPDSATLNSKDNGKQHTQQHTYKANSGISHVDPQKFNELKSVVQNLVISDSAINEKIRHAQSLNDLLIVLRSPNISEESTLKIISSVTTWLHEGNENTAAVATEEKNARSLKMTTQSKPNRDIDLSIPMEFHKYANLSISGMIQVIFLLAEQGKRNAPLLRYLSQHIIQYSDTLSGGQCSKLLYSLSVLNFIEENLLSKVCVDIMQSYSKIKPKMLSSAMKSLGTLKYKDEELFHTLCNSIVNDEKKFTPVEMATILFTFATVGYSNDQIDSIVQRCMLTANITEFAKSKWLDFVYSLVLLNKAQNSDVAHVLDYKFISEFKDPMPVARQVKLLHINAAAQFLLKDYNGPLIDSTSKIAGAVVPLTKSKLQYQKTLSETLKHMLPSSAHFALNVNIGMGFVIDAVLCLDEQNNLIPISNEAMNSDDAIRIAMIINDYHDYCRGKKDLLGTVNFQRALLQAKGYRVLNVSYQHFGTEDNLLKRSKYLNELVESVQETY